MTLATLPFRSTIRRAISRVCRRDIVLNHDAGDGAGFGDMLAWAWLAEGMKAGPVRMLHYSARGRRRDFLEMFGQKCVRTPRGSIDMFSAGIDEYTVNRGNVPRLESWARTIGVECRPARPPCAPSPPHLMAWAGMLRKSEVLAVLCPQVTHRNREWPVQHWSHLVSLLLGRGIYSVVLTHYRDRRFANALKCPVIHGADWEHFAALIRQADIAIGLENGASMFAGTLGIKTLALMGPGNPGVFAHVPEVTCLYPDEVPCIKCSFQRPMYRDECDGGCHALARLYPHRVAEAAERMLCERSPIDGSDSC